MNGSLLGIVAREIMGRPDAHLASMESLHLEDDGFDGVKVVLVDAPLLTRGKNAGRPNWRARTNEQMRLLSNDVLAAAERAWAERTGLCVECVGTGRTFVGWRLGEGTRFASCKACNATGSTDGVTPSATLELSLFEASA